MKQLLAVITVLASALVLSACEDANEAKEQAKDSAVEAKEEISQALNKPLGTIKTYMTRGKQKMREIYEGGSHAKLQ